MLIMHVNNHVLVTKDQECAELPGVFPKMQFRFHLTPNICLPPSVVFKC